MIPVKRFVSCEEVTRNRAEDGTPTSETVKLVGGESTTLVLHLHNVRQWGTFQLGQGYMIEIVEAQPGDAVTTSSPPSIESSAAQANPAPVAEAPGTPNAKPKARSSPGDGANWPRK